MHRPPRPAIKSSLMFPLHPLRRILTPEAFYQEQDLPMQDAILKNMRDNALPSQIQHTSYNTPDMHNWQLSSKNQPKPIISNTRAFKIRNHTHSNRIKENTIPIRSGKKIPKSTRMLPPSKNTLQTQKGSTMKKPCQLQLTTIPPTLDLMQIGNRIQYQTINDNNIEGEQNCLLLIMEQSLLNGNLNDDNTIKRVKKICKNLQQLGQIKLIIKIQHDRHIQQIKKSLMKHEVDVDMVIWPKTKHYERVTVLDITDVANMYNTHNIMVLADQFQYCHTIYYSTKQDQNKEITMDLNIRYLYLSLYNTNCLGQFVSQTKLSLANGVISTQNKEFRDVTSQLMGMEEVRRKIEVAKCRKNRKANNRIRKRSSSKDIAKEKEYVSGSMQNIQEKTEQFKRKMIQYVRILQEDKDKRQNRNPISKPSSAQSGRASSCGVLKLVESRHDSRNMSKTSSQIVYELLKNNNLVHKQIAKYQQQTMGVELEC